MIRDIKKSIDFAIFNASPKSWDNPNTHTNKLGTYLQFVQDSIDGTATSPDKVDPNSQTKLKELKLKIKDKIADLERQKTNASKSEIKEFDIRIKELKDAQREIETIISSTTNYVFQTDPKPQFAYDKKSDTGTIKYDGSIGSLINEMKHAFQFETGQIDFYQDKNSVLPTAGLTYDIYDEIETYKRQYAYDGILKFTLALTKEEIIASSQLSKTKGYLGIGRVDLKKMKDIKVNVIIKVADSYALDPLYDKLATKHIDYNSPAKDVIKANKKRPAFLNTLGIKSFDKNKPYIEFVKAYISVKPYLHVKY